MANFIIGMVIGFVLCLVLIVMILEWKVGL